MRKFITTILHRLFPATYQIHFRNKEGVVYSATTVEHNKIVFWWLKKPCHYSQLDGKSLAEANCRRSAPAALIFFTPESVDRHIEQLKRVKLNLELDEGVKILKEGGTMNWEKESEEMMGKIKFIKYLVYFQMRSEPNVQVSDTTGSE